MQTDSPEACPYGNLDHFPMNYAGLLVANLAADEGIGPLQSAVHTTKSVQNLESLLPSPQQSRHLSHWRGKGLYQLGEQFDKRKFER